MLGVEFKAKGASSSARSQFSIRKDVQKLGREPTAGMWFHLLESVDNGTIPKLLDVLAEAFADLLQTVPPDSETKPIIFHPCVLRHGFSIHKTLEIGPSMLGTEELRRKLFLIYRVTRSSLLNVAVGNSWLVHRRQG